MRKLLLIQNNEEQMDEEPPTVNVRKLFNRIPDPVVLSVSTRELQLSEPATCLCGWVVKEALSRTTGVAAEEISATAGWHYADERCAELFGGPKREWEAVFEGVTDERLPVIETAWVERVDKAVRRSR